MGSLSIDLSAVKKNYGAVRLKLSKGCRAGVVVKANAYGCGIAAVAPALERAGAEEFFVATLPEALELRTIVTDHSRIFTFGGFENACADYYTDENIIPVLNTMEDIQKYAAHAQEKAQALPAILHIDTGMNRLGLERADITKITATPECLNGIDLRYVMSHFASSDDKSSALNEAQYQKFKTASAAFDGVPKSLANSSGVFRNADYHFDLARTGVCLYGVNPTPETDNPMHRVVTLSASILQVRTADKGETCGYNETYRFEKKTRLAVVDIGYADGFMIPLSNAGAMYWRGVKCPIRGRVSMDTTIVDLSDVPEKDLPKPGDQVEVIGEHQSADQIAADAGTIGYEVLTSLSRRYQRHYVD